MLSDNPGPLSLSLAQLLLLSAFVIALIVGAWPRPPGSFGSTPKSAGRSSLPLLRVC